MAAGDEAAGREDARHEAKPRSKWAAAAAVFPGLVLHGSGHWVAGEKQTGSRLAALEGAGLAVALLGAVPLALTGAQRHLAGPGIALTLAGGGALLTGWFADIYGASGGAALGGEPTPLLPELSAGLGFVYDPQFAHGPFAVVDARLFFRPGLGLSAVRWEGLDGDARHVRGRAAYRVLGQRAPGNRTDGSFLDLRLGYTRLRLIPDEVTEDAIEIGASARWDLFHIGRSLRGAFVELELGLGYDWFGFGSGATEGSAQLLGGFGFGIYLGRGRGEATLYYDHRRDDFAGGLAIPNAGNGFIGSFGARAHYWLSRSWGVRGEFEVGSAYVSSLALAYRFRSKQ